MLLEFYGVHRAGVADEAEILAGNAHHRDVVEAAEGGAEAITRFGRPTDSRRVLGDSVRTAAIDVRPVHHRDHAGINHRTRVFSRLPDEHAAVHWCEHLPESISGFGGTRYPRAVLGQD
jgi:hypothetical protein